MSERNGLDVIRVLVREKGGEWAHTQPHEKSNVLVVVMNLGQGNFVTFEVIDWGDRYEVTVPFTKPETGDRVHRSDRIFETVRGLSDCLILILLAWKPDKAPERRALVLV
jgi:hypothetical protein